MYHVSPTDDRASVERHGIDYTKRDRTRDWRFEHDDPERYPEGNYVTDDIDQAREKARSTGGDLFKVNTEGIHLYEDPDLQWKGRSWYTTEPLGPERIEHYMTPEEADPYSGVKLSYEWVRNSDGNIRWGPLGAAGMLFHHPETDSYLLAHRSPEVDQGDTWGIPGGAIDPGEDPYQAALREAEEELGHVPHHEVTKIHTASPVPDWSYHTVMADVPDQFEPEYDDLWETQGHGWFTPEEIAGLNLHPGFAAAWNGGHLRKEAKHGFFYHTAPRKYRRQIEEQGLVPTDEAPVSPWKNLKGWQRQEQPPGVYMWDDPMNARGYAFNLEGRKAKDGAYPGDSMENMFDTDDFMDYMENYPGQRDEYGDPIDEDDYYIYEGKFKPEPLYDIWKVNTLGYEPQIDPEEAIHEGEINAEQAQEIINQQADWDGKYDPSGIDRMDGHRWYVPHIIEPRRLTLHESIYPEEMTARNAEDSWDQGKQVPNAWHRVHLDEWNPKARQRYLGDPRVMREINPQDRTY